MSAPQTQDMRSVSDETLGRDPLRIVCPVCHETRQLKHESKLILCGNCLAVLVRVRPKPKAKPGSEVRRLSTEDLAGMSESELQPLREARNRRLRARLLAKWLAESQS